MRRNPITSARFAVPHAIYASIFFLALSVSSRGFSASQDLGKNDMENPFDEAFWGLEFTLNEPVNKTARQLAAGSPQPMVSYRYRLSTGWLMGAHAGFKSLHRKDQAEETPGGVSVLSVGYESLKGWRVYHPFYFFAGGKFQYLFPATEARLPVRRDDDYSAEFGASAVGMLAIKPAGKWLLLVRMDRWRGLATTRLQGEERSIGIMLNF